MNWQERAERPRRNWRECGEQKPLTWGTPGELMDILTEPHLFSPAPVPAVPEDWRGVMAELGG